MKIDLGSKTSGPGCCASPCCGPDKEKTYYPSLYINGDKKISLPDEGEAVIVFRKVDSGEDTRDPENPRYRCELEVRSIEPRASKNREDDEPMGVSVGNALKEAMRKKMKRPGYEDEE